MPNIPAAGALVNAIISGPEGQKKEYMSIAGVDRNGNMKLPEKTFQWWPETFQDDIEVGWSKTPIPGASHGLMKWGQNGGRRFSFETILSRTIKPKSELNQLEYFDSIAQIPGGGLARGTTGLGVGLAALAIGALGFSLDPEDERNSPTNVDIKFALKYLRAFCYPTYEVKDGATFAHPPPICLLNLPNMGLNEDGRDVVWCVMVQNSHTYLKCFPNGEPRVVSVSLAFEQIVQSRDGVEYKEMSNLMQSGGGSKYRGAGHTGSMSRWRDGT